MRFPVTTYGLTGTEIDTAKITYAKSVCIVTANTTLTAQCIHLSSTTRFGRFGHHRVEPQHTRKYKPRLLWFCLMVAETAETCSGWLMYNVRRAVFALTIYTDTN